MIMQAIFAILNIVSGTIITLGALLALATSLREGEKRAAALSFVGLILNCLLWTAFILFHYFPVIRIANIIVLVALLVLAVISALKFFPAAPQPELHSIILYDERDHMFSRNALKFDPEHKKIYYETLHPELLKIDASIQAKPDLGEPGATYYDPLYSPAFVAVFSFLERLKPLTAGKTAQSKDLVDPIQLKQAIRTLALHYGAADVGFAKLEKYHFYSHRGRTADNWGQPIDCAHKTGIVIVIPMKVRALKQAPRLQVVNESARSYTEAAKVACVVAEYLRHLGYEALAQTDGNYLAPLVPIAAEAGLGEVSRMGLLIHPRLGPCLRLSMVSTELELPPDEKPEFGVSHFCRLCKKCADNCPTRSISRDDEPPLDRGVRHWKIIQEKCYSFWKSIGTDCGICLSVCPYTKEDNLFHRMVRSYISRNSFNQRLALLFDDLFYGRRRRIPV
jgi:ferredoxin